MSSPVFFIYDDMGFSVRRDLKGILELEPDLNDTYVYTGEGDIELAYKKRLEDDYEWEEENEEVSFETIRDEAVGLSDWLIKGIDKMLDKNERLENENKKLKERIKTADYYVEQVDVVWDDKEECYIDKPESDEEPVE